MHLSAIIAAANIVALDMGNTFHPCSVKFLGKLDVYDSNFLTSLYAKCVYLSILKSFDPFGYWVILSGVKKYWRNCGIVYGRIISSSPNELISKYQLPDIEAVKVNALEIEKGQIS